MTVHEFLMMLARDIGSVDMNDTQFVIRLPDGDYTPTVFDWDEDVDGQDGLVLHAIRIEEAN